MAISSPPIAPHHVSVFHDIVLNISIVVLLWVVFMAVIRTFESDGERDDESEYESEEEDEPGGSSQQQGYRLRRMHPSATQILSYIQETRPAPPTHAVIDIEALKRSIRLHGQSDPSFITQRLNDASEYKLSSRDALSSELTDCAICLDQVRTGQDRRVLWCEHKFHNICIETWLNGQGNGTCPICRTVPDIHKMSQLPC
ncbi:hypothetical protein IFM89_016620 [Coptis chinensis]|uniref:RING-type domain-containing protein n=1 Tax=Coptis chinensis TaxID=261450 RepID=A0A835INW8_9MAGN|nr:hypothetical protein IFM89_016620 [Coptis chinensis]